MRAVNLIPSEDRRGAGGAAGRSGGGAYVLLGGLAAAVAMAAGYVVTDNAAKDKQAEVTRVTNEAARAEAQAQSLASYTKFTSLRTKRVETVSQLVQSRFDWAHALHEVARVLPENAWLTDMTATTSPSVSLSGGGSGLRSALAVPAIEMKGCTTSQRSVAKMMARMRLVDGVQRVSLSDAEKGDDSAAGASGGSTTTSGVSGDCRGGHAKFPQFDLVVFFNAPAIPAPAVSGATPTAATSSTTPSSTPPAPTGGTTP